MQIPTAVDVERLARRHGWRVRAGGPICTCRLGPRDPGSR